MPETELPPLTIRSSWRGAIRNIRSRSLDHQSALGVLFRYEANARQKTKAAKLPKCVLLGQPPYNLVN